MFPRFSTQFARSVTQNLPGETRRALGRLHGAPRGIAALTIEAMPPAVRISLATHHLITTAQRADGTTHVTVTSRGLQVIKLCAKYRRTQPCINTSADLSAAVHEASDLLSLAPTATIHTTPA